MRDMEETESHILVRSRAQHFPSNLYPYPDHNHHHRHMSTHTHPQHDMCPPMPTHAIQVAPMYSKNYVMCITCLHQVLVESNNKRSFIVTGFNHECFLVSVFHAPEKLDSDLELDARMHKIDAHPCPRMNNNIAPMPKTHGHGHPMQGSGSQKAALLLKCGRMKVGRAAVGSSRMDDRLC